MFLGLLMIAMLLVFGKVSGLAAEPARPALHPEASQLCRDAGHLVLIPELARSWSVSADQKTFRFELAPSKSGSAANKPQLIVDRVHDLWDAVGSEAVYRLGLSQLQSVKATGPLQVEFKFRKARSDQLRALCSLPIRFVAQVRQHPQELEEFEKLRLVLWNTARKPLHDSRVRRALAHLLSPTPDTKHSPAIGLFSRTSIYADPLLKAPGFDPKTAQQLLLAASVSLRPLRIAYVEDSGSPFPVRLAQFKTAAEKIGVRIETQSLPWPLFLVALAQAEYDGYALALERRPNDSLISMLHSQSSQGRGANLFGYQNSEFDRLFEKFEGSRDSATRRSLGQSLDRLFQEEQVFLMIDAYHQPLSLTKREGDHT